MGRERNSSTTVVNQQTTPQATPEEQRLNQLEIQRQEAAQPGQIEAQSAGLDLVGQLLRGNEPLPGFFNQLSQGIGEDVTSGIVQQSLRDLYPQFQSSGILDSGVAAEIAGRTAGDIRRGVAEFNLGNKFNLLNLALSGQAQVQQPLLAQSQILSSRLAGLRPVTSSGTTTGNSVNRTNFFASPFGAGFGQGLGQGLGGGISRLVGGG